MLTAQHQAPQEQARDEAELWPSVLCARHWVRPWRAGQEIWGTCFSCESVCHSTSHFKQRRLLQRKVYGEVFKPGQYNSQSDPCTQRPLFSWGEGYFLGHLWDSPELTILMFLPDLGLSGRPRQGLCLWTFIERALLPVNFFKASVVFLPPLLVLWYPVAANSLPLLHNWNIHSVQTIRDPQRKYSEYDYAVPACLSNARMWVNEDTKT